MSVKSVVNRLPVHRLVLVISMISVSIASGEISDICIDCIAKVEIGKPNLCNLDLGTLSCGVYQIKVSYWIDCYRPGESWESCSFDDDCARGCIRTYMRRYEHICKEQLKKTYLSCEDYGRMHNGGGPKGCIYNRTEEVYVKKLMRKKCIHELQLDEELVKKNRTANSAPDNGSAAKTIVGNFVLILICTVIIFCNQKSK